MWLTDQAVKKPVLAVVLNLLLIAFGLIALDRLALRELPDVDPPVVSIETRYTGAAAQTVENRITKVLERRISGIEGIRFIDAQSIDGLSTINIEFTINRDIDHAANDVRERVFSALRDLPDDADAPEVFKVDSNNNVIMWLNLDSVHMNAMELTDYAERHLVDRLSVVNGVARVRIGGEKRFAMRIWLDRKAMVGKNVSVQDIENALRANNLELPAGRIESIEREFPVWVERQFNTPEDFSRLVIRREADGHLLRLYEVAKVELGPEDRRSELRGNARNMIGLGIIKQSKANTLDVAHGIKNALKDIKLPPGMHLHESYDTSVFIEQAIIEVIKAFAVALFLVILVIFVFLGNFRSILIPFFTIPVSITSTFIVLYLAGFSINLLTLLGLVLAIGLVVDDAIVVLENINRRINLNEPPLLASYRGARQVGFAVIATTTVLLAVFLPISLLQGNVGRLFSEFAFTLAAAVSFSTLVALTLTPVMCAYILHKKERQSLWGQKVNRFLAVTAKRYQQSLKFCLRHSYGMLVLFVLLVLTGAFLYQRIPDELIPKEDRGSFFVLVKAPEGASFAYTQKYMRQLENILMQHVKEGHGSRVITIFPQGLGSGDPVNSGFAILVMDNWSRRKTSTFAVMDEVRRQLATLPGVIAVPVMRSGIGAQSQTQPVQFVLGGTDYEELIQWRDILLKEAAKNPGLTHLDSDYDPGKIQINLVINYERAAEMGVSVEEIGRALETFLGSRDVTTFIDKDEEYDVILEAALDKKAKLEDLKNIYVRSSRTNQLIPIANLAHYEETTVPNALYRFNRMKAITITASLAEGYSLGEALTFLEELANKHLPAEAHIDYKDQSRDFKESQTGIYFTFSLALLVMFLVMAAQFGSFIHPLVIFITAPIAVIGALFGLYVTGNSFNIYSQIGLIMLVGLAAKNAILMIEFINQLREQQVKFLQAVIEGSVVRLRPVLMTAISTIFGSLPLVFATGAGAESRVSIGVVIFFGVSIATFLSLFAVPVVYAKLAKRTKARNYTEQRVKRLDSDIKPKY